MSTRLNIEIKRKMVKNKKVNRTEKKILEEINSKLALLVLLQSLQGKDKEEQVKILKKYRGNLSKRELGRITGVNRDLL